MVLSVLTGLEAPARAKREPALPAPTDLEVAMATLQQNSDAIKASGLENAQAIQAAVDRAIAEASLSRDALQKQLEEDRSARAASEARLQALLDSEVAARLDLERQLAEERGRRTALEDSLAAERARPMPAATAPAATTPSDFRLKFTRGPDGKINGDVTIVRIPKG